MINVKSLKKIYLLFFISIFAFKANSLVFNLAYSHKSYVIEDHSDWMKKLNNDKKLSHLSIIGTHGSGARFGGDISQNQSLTIQRQLQAGARILDISLKLWENTLYVYHGTIYQWLTFDDVVEQITDFLNHHPTETVILRIRVAGKPVKPKTTFADALLKIISEKKEFFYETKSSLGWVTLGETRKQIVLLRDFTAYGDITKYGYKYSKNNPKFVVSDAYHLSTNWALYKKWLTVKEAIKFANDNHQKPEYQSKAFVTFLSGSGGSFPYFVVSGKSSHGTFAPLLSTGLTTPAFKKWYPDFPRKSCFGWLCSIFFLGTNPLTYKHIKLDKTKFTGWLLTDFPGPGLLRRVINLNKNLQDIFTIDIQEDISKLKYPEYLNEMFKTTKQVRVTTSNGNWIDEFTIPEKYNGMRSVLVDVKSTFSVTVRSGEQETKLEQGNSKIFQIPSSHACYRLDFINDVWQWVQLGNFWTQHLCEISNECDNNGICYSWSEIEQNKDNNDNEDKNKNEDKEKSENYQCYWLSNITNRWEAATKYTSQESCRNRNKCQSNGGCYKWAKNPNK